jgi:serine/threonine-protein kinase
MGEEAKETDPGGKKKPESIPIPTSLSDRFRVEDQIGQGGFGSVYRVFEPGSGNVYALKILTLEGGFGRARREIRAARQVQHPRVIRCHEADVLEEHAYFLFELADGSLKELLRYRRKHPEAWDVICDACEGVAALHEQGIVHRDLKPSNILLTSKGGKVADLGLAEVESNNALRRKKEVVGTPQYMSPEQARGEEATPAADIYALAVMAYVCLEGQLPYRGKDTPPMPAGGPSSGPGAGSHRT